MSLIGLQGQVQGIDLEGQVFGLGLDHPPWCQDNVSLTPTLQWLLEKVTTNDALTLKAAARSVNLPT